MAKNVKETEVGSTFKWPCGQEALSGCVANTLREVEDFLGLHTVLKPKQRKLHTAICNALAECLQPRDAIEWMYVRDYADQCFQIVWLKSLQTRQVKHQTLRAVRLGYRKAMSLQNQPVDTTTRRRAILRLRDRFNDAATFPKWIEPYERVEALLARAEEKLAIILSRLAAYRASFPHGVANTSLAESPETKTRDRVLQCEHKAARRTRKRPNRGDRGGHGRGARRRG